MNHDDTNEKIKIFGPDEFEALANAVRSGGQNMESALETIDYQVQLGATGVQSFFLKFFEEDENYKSSIQLTLGTKRKLEALKRDKDTFEDVILRLVDDNVNEGQLCDYILKHVDKITCFNCGEHLVNQAGVLAVDDTLGVIRLDPGNINYPIEPDEPVSIYFECVECSRGDANGD